jgi:glycosyltransferase involved in cell wall biosynthesis
MSEEIPKLTITASHRNRLKIGDNSTEFFIKSLQWQACKDFEVLIADGGSENYEEIKDYIENYDGPVKMRMIQHKIGDEFQRAFLNNFGIRNARTPYVMTTDVDMLYGPGFVERLCKKLKPGVFMESRTMYWKKPIATMVYSGEIDPCKDLDACKVGRIKKRTTAGGCQCTHIDNWNKLRGFNENFIGWGSEDQELLKRVKLLRLKVKWMGETRESIQLFHQPHLRPNLKQDLAHQEKNKRRLRKVGNYAANPEGWGGMKDEEI